MPIRRTPNGTPNGTFIETIGGKDFDLPGRGWGLVLGFLRCPNTSSAI